MDLPLSNNQHSASLQEPISFIKCNSVFNPFLRGFALNNTNIIMNFNNDGNKNRLKKELQRAEYRSEPGIIMLELVGSPDYV